MKRKRERPGSVPPLSRPNEQTKSNTDSPSSNPSPRLAVEDGDDELKPDLDMAAGFLQQFRPGGPWTLVATKEYEDGRTHRVSEICTTEAMVREFITRWNVDHNIGLAL